MNPKDNIMLTGISQTLKDKCTVPFLGGCRDSKGDGGYQGWEEGEGVTHCSVGTEFQFGKMKKLHRWLVVMVTQHTM
jgi:hypothetical protein